MKTSFLIIGILSTLATSLISQNKNIAFEKTSFEEIKAKALKENKLIFIDAYTTWCGPCKQMARDVFTNDLVAQYYNSHFINAKIDMEKGEGLEIAKLYEVQCYPNLLFIDGKGNLVHRLAGSMSAKQFILLGKDAENPEKQFLYYTKNYTENKNNADFLIKYIEARENTCLSSEEMVNYYFKLQKDEDLTSKANWNMILQHVNSMDSKEFTYVLNHKQKFIDLYTEESVNQKIDEVSEKTLATILNTKKINDDTYKVAKLKVQALNTPNTKSVLFDADLNYAERTANWINYSNLAVANVDTYYIDNADKLNTIAWNFYENVEDKNALLKAEEWAKKASSLVEEYPFLDTYAAVLYKCGKKDLASSIANKAIKLAQTQKYSPEEYQGTVDLLEKIKKLK